MSSLHFVYPGFLFALFSIAIPIIIHLFNLRKFKKVYFTNVHFLKEIKQETQAKSKLKHLLVLLSRILALIFLVLAFTQPYFTRDMSAVASIKENKIISIYVDNSFSMEAVGKNGMLLEEAKRKAKEIALAYGTSDQFQLLTNDFEARHQYLFNRDEFINLADEIKVSPSVRNISQVLLRQKEIAEKYNVLYTEYYIISDFQKNSTDIETLAPAIKTDSLQRNINIVPLVSQNTTNVYIDSCWLSSPVVQLNQANELNVQIINSSKHPLENIPIKLTINSVQKALASISIDANSMQLIKMNFTINEAFGFSRQQAEVSLTDYPITFDDTYFFAFDIAKEIKVLSVNREEISPYLTALFNDKDKFFEFKNVSQNQIDYSALSAYTLIILNNLNEVSSGLAQELKKFIEFGGSLVIFPGTDINREAYNEFLSFLNVSPFNTLDTAQTKVLSLDIENPLFEDVFEEVPENIDLPIVKEYYTFLSSTRSTEVTLLKLQNGFSFLSKYNFDKGNIYLFAAPLGTDYGNLVRHAIFVPIMYKIALLSIKSQKPAYDISEEEIIELSSDISGDKVFHLTKPQSNFDIIPEHKVTSSGINLLVHGQIKEAGSYNLLMDDSLATILSFNYSRKESDIKYYSADALENLLNKFKINARIIPSSNKNFTKNIIEIKQGIQIWKVCIILALLFLGIEIFLLKYKPKY